MWQEVDLHLQSSLCPSFSLSLSLSLSFSEEEEEEVVAPPSTIHVADSYSLSKGSFAEYSLFYRVLLQKRPLLLRTGPSF